MVITLTGHCGKSEICAACGSQKPRPLFRNRRSSECRFESSYFPPRTNQSVEEPDFDLKNRNSTRFLPRLPITRGHVRSDNKSLELNILTITSQIYSKPR